MKRSVRACTAGALALALTLGVAPALATTAWAEEMEGSTSEASQYVATDESGVQYKTLQEAVNAALTGDNEGTVDLTGSVTLTSAIQVPKDAVLTINGNGNTITLKTSGNAALAAFNNSSVSTEGLYGATKLYVSNTNFVGDAQATQGHAVIVSSQASDAVVSLTGCSFTNLHEAVYCNNVNDDSAVSNKIVITGCKFTNVAYSYSVDDVSTNDPAKPARVDKHNVTVDPDAPAAETFAVASVAGAGYSDLNSAIAAAESAADKTVSVRKDVVLNAPLVIDKKGVTFDLNGHTISSDESFMPNDGLAAGKDNLVTVTADDVTVKGGTIKTGSENKNALNLYCAKNVTLENMKLDHSTNNGAGAPLIVGASNVTVKGALETVTGKGSWYAINVDVSKTAGKKDASLNFADDAVVTFSGTSNSGIYLENSASVSSDDLAVSFGKGVTINAPEAADGFVPVSVAEGAAVSVVNPENAGIGMDENGTAHFHKGEKIAAVAPTCKTEGNAEYYVCDKCGKLFSDEAMTDEVTMADVTLPANPSAHSHLKLEGFVAPTTEAAGYTGDVVCADCGATVVKGSAIDRVDPGQVVMMRLYNPYTGEHLYTSSEDEVASCVEAGWSYEGVAWVAPTAGDAVYRLYNPYSGDHHYTMDAGEYDSLQALGWKGEGVAWYSAKAEGGVPVYRQFNPYETVGTHNYTVSKDENDSLVALGWRGEGVAWYAVR